MVHEIHHPPPVASTSDGKRRRKDVEAELPAKAKKHVNNYFTNQLKPASIRKIVTKLLETTYRSQGTKGRKRSLDLGFSVPYLLKRGDSYFINPYAFSTTKGAYEADDDSEQIDGYFTIPVQRSDMLENTVIPSEPTNGKSTWIPRILLHSLFWRYFNDFSLIPQGMEVSHLSGQKHRISRDSLCVEFGYQNRSREICLRDNWHSTRPVRGDSICRCQHEPICQSPRAEPTDEDYRRRNVVPPEHKPLFGSTLCT